MSGGYFNYDQYVINNIANRIDSEYAFLAERYDAVTLAQIETGLMHLRLAAVYAERIDWLLSGDDSEDAFAERLPADLRKIK